MVFGQERAGRLWDKLLQLYLLGVNRKSLMTGVYSTFDYQHGGEELRDWEQNIEVNRQGGLTPLLAECLSKQHKEDK